MAKIRLTKEFSFEMAHVLEGYDGACSHIHGHSYRLFVTVIGETIEDVSNPKLGMVMDFGDLKKIVNNLIVEPLDHCLVVRDTPQTHALLEQIKGHYKKVEIVDYQPTCENMITRFADMIAENMPESVQLSRLKLHETATSYAEWYSSDNI